MPCGVRYVGGMRKDHEPVAGIVGGICAAAVVIPLGMWLKAKQADWSTGVYVTFCVGLFGLIYLAARWLDKREADQSLKEAHRSKLLGLDLPRSEYRNLSSPEKQE